jgi:hypothetical protein
MKFEWKTIFSEAGAGCSSRTIRAKVHGGWIVITTSHMDFRIVQSSVFVPDPKHDWEVEEV